MISRVPGLPETWLLSTVIIICKTSQLLQTCTCNRMQPKWYMAQSVYGQLHFTGKSMHSRISASVEFDPSGGNRARSGKIHPALMSCNKVCKLVYFYKMLGLAETGKNKTYWMWSRNIYNAVLLVPTSYRINGHLEPWAAPDRLVRLWYGPTQMLIFQGSLHQGDQQSGA